MVGDYLPGSKLSIRSVAAGMGISTMPVREALKRLVSERALKSSANRSFQVDRLAPKRVSDLFFLRACLEGIATELATPLLTGAQIDRLDELAVLTSDDVDEGNMDHYLVHNYSFHFTIYTAAGNAELVSIIEGLWAQTGPYLRAGCDHRLTSLEWQRDARAHRQGHQGPRRGRRPRPHRARHKLGHRGLQRARPLQPRAPTRQRLRYRHSDQA